MPPKRVLSISATAIAASHVSGVRSALVEVSTVRRLDQAVAVLRRSHCDALLLAEAMGDGDLALLRSELDHMLQQPLILCPLTPGMQAFSDRLSLHGIPHKVIPEISRPALLAAIDGPDTAAQSAAVASASPAAGWEKTLVGDSAALQRVREVIRLVASRSCTLLVTGESGTGKEVVARALHLAGNRSHRPFVSVNCAAIPSTLLESEMFGHVKGAFTGAVGNRVGCFEQAHQGTILLDEIGDTPLEFQAKILRVLQEREIQKIGSSVCTKVDVRVIAATNRDLRLEMNADRFRQDLFFRLRVVQLDIPPLRERPDDIPALVDHFLEKICRREGIGRKLLEPGVVSHLAEQPWPGNIRELEHSIERAIALSGDRETLDVWDFPPFCEIAPMGSQVMPYQGARNETIDLEQTVAKLERALIDHALLKSRGNKARAAQLLGLKRSTLVSKVRAFQARA